MKILIIYNKTRKNVATYIQELEKSLKKHTIDYDIVEGTDFVEENLKHKKFVIVVGGDGTILAVASVIAKHNIPILGINTGHVGFLTQIEKISDIDKAITKIVNKDYFLDKRSMLCACVYRKNKKLFSEVALNEVYLVKEGIKGVSRYNVYVDEQIFNNYSADGLIVSTPTGSTAYNLSAGGAIIAPTTKAIALTPICVHAFNQRGIVLDDNSKIKIQIETTNNSIVLDGKIGMKIEVNDEIVVKKDKKKLSFVKFNEDVFIKNLKIKMSSI